MKKRRLIYQINTARHSMMKAMDAGCRQSLDISVTQLTALMLLNEKNSCRMSDLAETLFLDKSAVTGLAKRMQVKGLIEKRPSTTDSRAQLLIMTEKGKDTLYNGFQHLNSVNQQISDGFTEEELDTVSRFLEHISQTFHKAD